MTDPYRTSALAPRNPRPRTLRGRLRGRLRSFRRWIQVWWGVQRNGPLLRCQGCKTLCRGWVAPYITPDSCFCPGCSQKRYLGERPVEEAARVLAEIRDAFATQVADLQALRAQRLAESEKHVEKLESLTNRLRARAPLPIPLPPTTRLG